MEKSTSLSSRRSDECEAMREKQDEISSETGPPRSVHETSKDLVTSAPAEVEWKYVTGWKLFAAIGAITAACFIILLDTSIIVTVR
jgi:hypothetical protein